MSPSYSSKPGEASAPCRALVLFGATGDLARRMLWPSLYALHRDGLLPEPFQLVGVATKPIADADFVARVREAILGSANAELHDEPSFEAFARRIRYVAVDAAAQDGFAPLRDVLAPGPGGVIFYLSTGPEHFGPIAAQLGRSRIADAASRIVVEKPIGTDARTAHEVNETMGSVFAERQVFRIDHYLGKEAVQNLLA
ncbi:MAG TPA: hypothetical protein PLK52_12415, partial [Usitatibacteraceae bacterium]|nr:hypothetical protein [Usitatibacteraceae bacterium]